MTQLQLSSSLHVHTQKQVLTSLQVQTPLQTITPLHCMYLHVEAQIFKKLE